MSQNTDRLTTMIKTAPDQVGQIEGSISQVEDNIEALQKEQSAIQDGVCGTTETDAIDILENTILIDKGGDYVSYGGNFGTINWDPLGNLTDWEIIKLIPAPPPVPPAPPDPDIPTPIYTYTPGDYPDLDQWVEDFAFGNDYLTRPPITGATYGIIPRISSLSNAANLLNENADKVGDSVAVFNRYAT